MNAFSPFRLLVSNRKGSRGVHFAAQPRLARRESAQGGGRGEERQGRFLCRADDVGRQAPLLLRGGGARHGGDHHVRRYLPLHRFAGQEDMKLGRIDSYRVDGGINDYHRRHRR